MTQEPHRRVPIWKPLASRDFRLVWSGSAVSLLGDQFFTVAVPWVVLGLTHSALQVGAVLTLSAVPRAALMLLGGAVTDRVPPRSITFYSNVARAVLVGSLALLVAIGALRMWQLYVLAALFGIVDAFSYPAFQTLLTMLVDTGDLPAANSLMQSSSQVSSLVGPAAAGVVVATAGTAAAFAIDAATFVFAAATLFVMMGGRGLAGGEPLAPIDRALLMADVRRGVALVWRFPPARGLLLLSAGLSLASAGPSTVGLAVVAEQRFGGAAGFGLMLSALGGGALAGALLAGLVRQRRHRGLTWLAICAAVGLCLAALGFASSVAVASALLALIGFGSGFLNVVFVAWLQAMAPHDMLGRIMSLMMFASIGLTPVSYVAAGAVAATHATLMFAAAGAFVVAVTAAATLDPAVRRID